MNPVLRAGIEYVEAGVSVLPIAPASSNGGKRPAINSWKEFEGRLATEQELHTWFSDSSRGIGIIGGTVSGNLEQLDFDCKGIIHDFFNLCQDAGLIGLVRQCAHVRTPSGGDHLYYRCEEAPEGNQVLARSVREGNEGESHSRRIGNKYYVVKTLIETRGQGGYTVAPPSPGTVHPSGRMYKLLSGDFTDLPLFTSDVRQALLSIAREFNQALPQTAQSNQRREAPATRAGLSPGDDYNLRGEWRSLLQEHGWKHVRNRAGIEDWRRPGKRTGISATVQVGEKGCPVFYVFSSNATPFEPNASYTPFSVYATLGHGGDFTAAARSLGRIGYGSQSARD